MNFISRAWLYIIRKKGKAFLLFIILLVMATFVLTALALEMHLMLPKWNCGKVLVEVF